MIYQNQVYYASPGQRYNKKLGCMVTYAEVTLQPSKLRSNAVQLRMLGLAKEM